ncbi:CHAT domain-containing protein [Flavilitoribacter nigricans]|nr:CHAT domain-containing tetratricopeptide repeat protein [Flavilitoribacter nigricans]
MTKPISTNTCIRYFLPFILCLLFLAPIQGQSSTTDPDAQRLEEILSKMRPLPSVAEAWQSYNRLSAICKNHQWWDSLLVGGFWLMEAQCIAGEYQAAIKTAERHIRVGTEKLGPDNQRLGNIYHKKGIYHFYEDEFEESEAAYLEAIRIRNSDPKPKMQLIANTYFNLSVLYRFQENYHQAAQSLNDLIIMLEDSPESEYLAGAYLEYGILLYFLGDFGQAEEYMLLGLDKYKKILQGVQEGIRQEDELGLLINIAYGYNNLSSLHHYQTDDRQAMDALLESIAINLDLGNQVSLAICYENLATLLHHQGAYERALEYYNQAEIIFQKEGKLLETASVYGNLGIMYKSIGDKTGKLADYQKATRYLERALQGRMRHQDGEDYHHSYAQDYNGLGDVQLALGKYEQALSFYQKAIINQFNDFKDEDYWINPDLNHEDNLGTRIELLRLLQDKANALFEWYQAGDGSKADLEKALETFLLCDQLIFEIRNDYESKDSKLFLQKESIALYEKAIGTTYELQQITGDERYAEHAFHFMENSKAVLLLANLKDFKARIAAKIPDSLMMQINRLKADIAFREKRMIAAKVEGDQALYKEAQSRLPQLKRLYQEKIRSLEERFPIYYQEKYNLQVVGTKHFREHLRQTSSSLVEYFVGEEKVYMFFQANLDARPRLFAVDLPAEQLGELSDAVVDNINSMDAVFNPEKIARYRQSAHELFTRIWQPFADLIPRQSRVIIVPAGYLGYVPFEALLTRPEEGMKFKNYPYLINDHPLSYAYSATILIENLEERPAEKQRKLSFLGIAPVFEDHPSLDHLPWNEVDEIIPLMGGKSFTHGDATREAFFRNVPTANIVHVCTHALTQEEPFDAWIELIDGPVHISELDTMDLLIEMIVLSACETGTGELEKGEGIMSLARRFAYAGCQSIVSSLWQVNAQSTASIMKAFYEQLADQSPKDIALQQAKISFFRNEGIDHPDAHPYYWTGFLQSGARRSIVTDNGTPWKYLKPLLFIFAILAGGYRWLGSRR